MTARTITECQICGDKHLESIIHLGWHPPVNNYHPIGQLPPSETFYPLHIVKCASRGHVQIDCQVNPQVLFPSSYPYRSRTTGVLRQNFDELATDCAALGLYNRGDRVIDIGSNDGTLLAAFKKRGARVYGIDPALEAAHDAKLKHDINTVVGYFGEGLACACNSDGDDAALVTACNVFAHIPDVHDFMRGVDALLAPDGVFVSESHYLPSLLETCQYDTIYHEHLRYYSLGAISDIMEQHGFSIFYANKIPTHGGSIRVYASRYSREKTKECEFLLEREVSLLEFDFLARFRRRVESAKIDLLENLYTCWPRKIYGIGAPSRASTLVNYCGLDDGILDCIVEIEGSPKIGKYMPGTTIPVVDERELYEKHPPYALILSWHIADEIMKNLRKRGYKGKFIVPLPEVRII